MALPSALTAAEAAAAKGEDDEAAVGSTSELTPSTSHSPG